MRMIPIDGSTGHAAGRARPAAVTVAALFLAAATSSCVTSRIEQTRVATTGISSSESIVILARRQNTEYETEESFTNCVGAALRGNNPSLNLHDNQEFLDQLFPWFEPRLAPPGPEGLPTLLSQPGVADRIADTGVRYLVWLDGVTEVVDGGGNISCDLAVGCIGMHWWENDSSYEASIWDLKNAESAGTISADASGTSYLPAIVVPIPLIARTKNAACKGLARQLEEFLVLAE